MSKGTLAPSVNRAERVDHCSPSKGEVKNAWSFTFTFSYVFTARYLNITTTIHSRYLLPSRLIGPYDVTIKKYYITLILAYTCIYIALKRNEIISMNQELLHFACICDQIKTSLITCKHANMIQISVSEILFVSAVASSTSWVTDFHYAKLGIDSV
jgi:hypothetical protein